MGVVCCPVASAVDQSGGSQHLDKIFVVAVDIAYGDNARNSMPMIFRRGQLHHKAYEYKQKTKQRILNERFQFSSGPTLSAATPDNFSLQFAGVVDDLIKRVNKFYGTIHGADTDVSGVANDSI